MIRNIYNNVTKDLNLSKFYFALLSAPVGIPETFSPVKLSIKAFVCCQIKLALREWYHKQGDSVGRARKMRSHSLLKHTIYSTLYRLIDRVTQCLSQRSDNHCRPCWPHHRIERNMKPDVIDLLLSQPFKDFHGKESSMFLWKALTFWPFSSSLL